MSSSEEYSSDEEELSASRSKLTDGTLMSVTVVSSSSSNSEDEILNIPRRSRKYNIVSSDEDEVEAERDLMSPCTRRSISGYYPPTFSNESSEIESSDEDFTKSKNEDVEVSGIEESIESGKEESIENGKEESIENGKEESIESGKEESIESGKEESIESGQTAKNDEDVSTEGSKGSEDYKNDKSERTDRSSNDSEEQVIERNEVNFEEEFHTGIREKLSSTIYEKPLKNDTDLGAVNDEPSDSDVEFVENSVELFEITGSDSGDNEAAIVENETKERKELVSKEFYDKETKKLNDIKADLLQTESLYKKLSKNLPDGGRQISLRIERLRADLKMKAKYVASLVAEDTIPDAKAAEVWNWNQVTEAVKQMQPKQTAGRVGLQNFNTQKAITVEVLTKMHGQIETCPGDNQLADNPNGLKVDLMDHQRHALAWMMWREKQKPSGGILADDMGLGKTLTVISLVLADKNAQTDSGSSDDSEGGHGEGRWTSKGRKKFYRGGTLVVCPASLLHQWELEVKAKVSRNKLTVHVHHGKDRHSHARHLRTYNIVLTTFNLVSRENKDKGTIFGLKWQRIVLDEGHVIRNHKSQMSIAACALNGKSRWILTGTPIHNKEMDMFALLKFLRCDPFDNLAHWKTWVENKSAGGQQRLSILIKTIMLRRTKEQLQQRGTLQALPQKHTELIEIELAVEEMNVYQKMLGHSRSLFAQFLDQRSSRGDDPMGRIRDTGYQQHKPLNAAYLKAHEKFTKLHECREVKSHEILTVLLRLRQICCHPGLIDAMLEDEETQSALGDSTSSHMDLDILDTLKRLVIDDSEEKTMDDVAAHSDSAIARASSKLMLRSNPVFDMKRPSSKMIKVLQILQERVLNSDDKAIIVSQWTTVLKIIDDHLKSFNIKTLSMNGSVPVSLRQDIVNEFNDVHNKKKILLLSLTAGGVGLNLIGANHMLLIDLHWNPQLDAQAQDRVYRVGQKKNVHIYRFMCKDTVEERIRLLQERKLLLANDVLTGTKTSVGSKLSIEDLKSLFGM